MSATPAHNAGSGARAPGSGRIESTGLLPIFAEAYRQAAAGGIVMRNAADVFETVRTGLIAAGSAIDAFEAVDRAIATTNDEALRGVLVGLKRAVDAELISAELDALFGHADEQRPVAWRRVLAMAANDVWQSLIQRLMALRPAIDRVDGTRNARLGALSQAILDETWVEALPLYLELGSDDAIERETRAGLLATAAIIQSSHVSDTDAARVTLEAADAMAANLPRVIYAWGAYCIDVGDLEQAMRHADALLSRQSPEADGELLIGNCLEIEKDHDGAELAYGRGIAINATNLHLQREVLGILGRPDRITASGPGLKAQARRIAALDDWVGEYGVWLELAALYQQAEDFARAHEWVRRAIAIDETRAPAYQSEGAVFLDDTRYDEAKGSFRRAVERNPAYFDAWWGLAEACTESGDLDEAVASYRRCLSIRPVWEARIRATIGELLRTRGQLDEAEKELVAALEADREHQAAVESIQLLAIDLAQKDVKRGLGLLRRVRKYRGEGYEAEYRNVVGTVYYAAGEYEAALKSFRLAIRREASDPVYRTNLADAYAALDRWEEARRELEVAYELDHDEDRHRRALGQLANERGNRTAEAGRYEAAIPEYEAALSYAPDDPVIHANLSYALEMRGSRVSRTEDLARAVQAMDRAVELDPDHADYRRRADYLMGCQRLVRERGEQAIDLIAIEPPIAIELSSALESLFVGDGPGGLEPSVGMRIDATIGRLVEWCGVELPGVRIRIEDDLLPGSYQLELYGITAGGGVLLASKPNAVSPAVRLDGVDSILAHLERLLARNLSAFVTVDSVSEALRELEEEAADEIASSSQALIDLTQVLRACLAEQIPLKDLAAVCREFGRARSAGSGLVEVAEQVRAVMLRASGLLERGSSEVALSRRQEETLARWLKSGGGQALGVDAKSGAAFLSHLPVSDPATPGSDVTIRVRDPRLRPYAARFLGPGYRVVHRGRLGAR
jgi:tetratricopeptide (TPR) repeat protein